MLTGAINLLLLVVLIGSATLAAAAWMSPQWLAWAAAHLMARKESLEAGKAAHTQALSYWRGKLGVADAGKIREIKGGY